MSSGTTFESVIDNAVDSTADAFFMESNADYISDQNADPFANHDTQHVSTSLINNDLNLRDHGMFYVMQPSSSSSLNTHNTDMECINTSGPCMLVIIFIMVFFIYVYNGFHYMSHYNFDQPDH